jgi:hypothetical protein
MQAPTQAFTRTTPALFMLHATEQQLEAEIHTCPLEGAEVVIRASLAPGTDGAYLAEPAAARFMQWVQFISPATSGHSYLWDDREVLRRS